MAQIVLGIASSHSPQLSTPPEHWDVLVKDDMARPHKLIGRDGRGRTYAELLAQADPNIAKQIDPELKEHRYDVCQRAIHNLAQTIEDGRLDLLFVIGDDQDELLHADNMPAFSMYWGETLMFSPRRFAQAPGYYRYSAWSYGTEEAVAPVPSALAKNTIEAMSERGFDVAASHQLPDDRGIGHAFGFVHQRLLNGRTLPMIPVLINTFYAPNQPTARRCYDFGQALGEVIHELPGNLRVGVVASGGLSHFVVDSELDEQLLYALQTKDREQLRAFPQEALQSGTSEARNWIAAAAAMPHLDMKLIDYVPCYRSPAGTGCAMGFAEWS